MVIFHSFLLTFTRGYPTYRPIISILRGLMEDRALELDARCVGTRRVVTWRKWLAGKSCNVGKAIGSTIPKFTIFMGAINHQFIWVVYDIALPTFDMSDGLASRYGHFHREHSDRRNVFFFAFFWLYSLFRQIHTPMFFGSKRLPGFQWSQKPAGRDMVSQ